MNDFDTWQKAINKMDLTEAVAPIVRGVMLVEDSQVEMYNKIQKLLNSTGMESCHRFLYNLDPSELSESECQKVCNLYKLGQDRGFIDPDVVEDEEAESKAEDAEVKKECDLAPAAQLLPPSPPVVPMQQNAFTVLYSATRDGMVKSGEAFSNCVNTRSAKADVISKLERAGYQNISILAIEAGDPDMAGCENTYCAQANQTVPDYAYEAEDNEKKTEEDVDEADDREPLSHALDMVGVKASTANSKAQDAVQLNIEEKDKGSDDEADEKKSEDKESKAEDKPEKKNDTKSEGKADDEADDKEEASKEPDEKLKDDVDQAEEPKDDKNSDELSTADKENLKDSYKKAFKAAMKKCKFETSFSELSLEDKVQFFTELSKAWGDKADPSKFMTDKEVDQLEKIVVSK